MVLRALNLHAYNYTGLSIHMTDFREPGHLDRRYVDTYRLLLNLTSLDTHLDTPSDVTTSHNSV